MLGADQTAMRTALAQPVNATLLLAFLVSLFWHAQLGLQVIVEDYVHDERWKLLAIIGNTFFAIAIAAGAVYSLLKISWGV